MTWRGERRGVRCAVPRAGRLLCRDVRSRGQALCVYRWKNLTTRTASPRRRRRRCCRRRHPRHNTRPDDEDASIVLARFAGLSDGYGDGDDDHHQVPPRRTRHISMQH